MNRTRFRPSRALLHPLWLGSLTVLLLNDHLLKDAWWMPTMLAGKLSDVAGMLVAPVLLAALLGVKRRPGWVACHAAVGVVFAAIQVSTSAADGWSSLMASLGWPWVIVSDPSDLLALPFLLVSARVFERAGRCAAASLARRSGEVGAGLVGLGACVATSPPEPAGQGRFETEAYLHNGTERNVVVRIREMTEGVVVDCEAIADDPARLLPESAFGQGSSLDVPSGANVPLRLDEWLNPPPDADCSAFLIDADNLDTTMAFWQAGELDVVSIPADDDEFDVGDSNRVELTEFDDGLLALQGPIIVATPSEPADACEPQSDGERLVTTLPLGEFLVQRIDAGLDGCYLLEVASFSAIHREYLCLPSSMAGEFPFAVGELVEVEAPDEWTQVLTNEDGSVEMTMYMGADVPRLGVSAVIDPVGCSPTAADACAVTARAVGLTITEGGEQVFVRAGSSVVLDSGLEIHVARAEERLVVDPSCAAGPSTLGFDIELVAIAREGVE